MTSISEYPITPLNCKLLKPKKQNSLPVKTAPLDKIISIDHIKKYDCYHSYQNPITKTHYLLVKRQPDHRQQNKDCHKPEQDWIINSISHITAPFIDRKVMTILPTAIYTLTR
jgi:hypothetical protein